MQEGWFAVYRSVTDPSHDLHPMATGETACKLAAWVDLLGQARWKDSGGLKRGQLRASQSYLARRWNWSRSKVKRFLARLEEAGRIDRRVGQQSGRQATVISISNWDVYQNSRPARDPPKRPASGPQVKEVEGLKQRTSGARPRRNGKSHSLECANCGAEYLKEKGECPYCAKERRRQPA